VDTSGIHVVVYWVMMTHIQVTNGSEEPVPPFKDKSSVCSSETMDIPARLDGVITHKTAISTMQIVAVFL
jgi:hypothetical protein